ncbi:MAG: SDR family oxidoreductase [SAR202 cluster bacterium]|nr:SDR family oxidoreductase [SAR202 cluster bacterium]
MDFGIKGKVALVTGGSRGLGRQAALSLAGEGVNVAICGRTEATLKKTAGELAAKGVKAAYVIGDVSNISELDGIHKQVVAKLGPVDILVNNAGGSIARESVDGTSLEDYKKTFDLNLYGSYRLMQLVIPHMKQKRWGRIINIASIWGREYGGNIGYMSAKAALIAASKHSAVALAKHGILVNSLAPGSISHEGGGWEKFQRDNPPEAVADFIKKNLPLGKFGWPEPLGDMVAFLASDRAGMITGASIVVDGGQSISMI